MNDRDDIAVILIRACLLGVVAFVVVDLILELTGSR